MTAKRQDVRVTKTQRSLVQALFACLESRSFSKITINDICEEAMVSRSTFYAHFEDKYKLLHFSIQEVERRIFADFHDKTLHETLLVVLENMQRETKTLRNLMIAELDIEVIEMFRQHFSEIFKARIGKLGILEELSAPKLEVVASFYAAGVAQTLALWIGKRLPIGIEEMADTLCALLQGLEQGARQA